jgi:hypothetical protein
VAHLPAGLIVAFVLATVIAVVRVKFKQLSTPGQPRDGDAAQAAGHGGHRRRPRTTGPGRPSSSLP